MRINVLRKLTADAKKSRDATQAENIDDYMEIIYGAMRAVARNGADRLPLLPVCWMVRDISVRERDAVVNRLRSEGFEVTGRDETELAIW